MAEHYTERRAWDSLNKMSQRLGNQLSEKERVLKAQHDPQAFAELYDENYTTILNYVFRRVLSIEVAEDLTSSTFLKALRQLPRYRYEEPFRAWLYSIATNEVRMYQRSERRRMAREGNPAWVKDLERIYFGDRQGRNGASSQDKMYQYAQLHRSMNALPDRYQAVLTLKYFEGLGSAEIATVLKKREGTVKSLIHRGLKRLRVSLNAQE